MRIVALACTAILLWGTVAEAATPAQRREAAALVKKAGRLYAQGQYLEAAQALEEAQRLDPHPRIVYNLARAYDQGGELDKALTEYQRYIASDEGTDPTLLKRSTLAVDRLRGLLAHREETRRRAEEERARLEAEARAAEERARAEAEAKRAAEEQAARREREAILVRQQQHDRAQLAAWAATGVGAAALGTGGFFGFQALTAKSELGEAGTLQQKTVLAARARQSALIADVGYGIGVAAAVAAVVLWPKRPRAVLPGASLSVGPGGALVEVRF